MCWPGPRPALSNASSAEPGLRSDLRGKPVDRLKSRGKSASSSVSVYSDSTSHQSANSGSDGPSRRSHRAPFGSRTAHAARSSSTGGRCWARS
eukprot:scaffold10806_cov98-Isochrysis_galbana.AAC.1